MSDNEYLDRRRKMALEEQPELLTLEQKLLKLGGKAVAYQGIEEDLRKLLQKGRSYSPNGAILEKGQPSQCHWNVAQLWDVNRKGGFKVVTGYALSEDGIWRQHTWGLWKRKIVETTEKRTNYFGFELTGPESEEFYYNNL